MKLLVLGGNGYIGTRFCSKFKSTIVDLNLFGGIHEGIKEDYRNLDSKFLSGYDVIILLAAESSVSLAKINILNTVKNNVCGLLDLLDKCQRRTKIIYASSASVYGKSLGLSKESDILCHPLDVYDMTKLDMDKYSYFYKNNDITSVRFGTVSGFSENLRLDLVINSMFFSAKNEKRVIVSSPKTNRGILFIDDLVEVLGVMSNTMPFSVGRKIFNLCSYNSTVDDLAKEVVKFFMSKYGVTIPIEYESTNSSLYDFELDCTKLNTYLGGFLKNKSGVGTATICDNLDNNINNIKIMGTRK